MTLEEMCQMAARYSDRYDEFEKTLNEETGKMEYQEDALHYFNIFRDAINEAYHEAARTRCEPDVYTEVEVNDDGQINLQYLFPQPYSVKNVMNTLRTEAIAFDFETRFVLNVTGAKPGDTVCVYYGYLPERLEAYTDEPVFPDSAVDPMVYVSLAVARIWQSEKKLTLYESWMQDYYASLRQVRPTMKGGNLRRVPRGRFR
jgi:hypothetical protein